MILKIFGAVSHEFVWFQNETRLNEKEKNKREIFKNQNK
jgi:hypothetical protein